MPGKLYSQYEENLIVLNLIALSELFYSHEVLFYSHEMAEMAVGSVNITGQGKKLPKLSTPRALRKAMII